MKALVIAVGLVGTLLTAPPASAKPEPALRFATYNVCKTTCADGAFAWERRRMALVRNILSARPDVLALQEADKSYAWFDQQLGRHGYRRVQPHTTSCGACVDDSQLYYRTDRVRPLERAVENPPIPATCSPYFSSPGVLVDPPVQPEFPPQPQWDEPSPLDPDYDQKWAEYEAATAAWEKQTDEIRRLIRQQRNDYNRLMEQAGDAGCRQYIGWQPTHEAGSAEVALSDWGEQKWARSTDDRNLVWAVLTDTRTKAPFLAVSMHLPNEKSAAAEKYRKSLARAVPAELAELRKDLGADVPTVLMGDLNSFTYRQPRGAQWLLGRAGFRDAYAARSRVNAGASTVNVTTVRRDAFPARPVLSPRPARLDYVLFDRGRALRYEVHLRLRGGRFDNRFRGSDHNLVLADVRLAKGRLDGGWSVRAASAQRSSSG